jgi:hypothetical protein
MVAGCAAETVEKVRDDDGTTANLDEIRASAATKAAAREVMNPGTDYVPPEALDPDFRAGDEPLNEVLKRLGDSVRVNFKIDDEAMRAAGVKMDVPVAVHVPKARTASALNAVLGSASDRTAGKPGLGYTLVGHNTLLITTRAELFANYLYTREYNVAMFLIDPEGDASRRDSLVSLIKDAVDPPSWGANDGRCSIEFKGGRLKVTQTHENLRLIEQIFEDIDSTYGSDVYERQLHYGGLWVKRR